MSASMTHPLTKCPHCGGTDLYTRQVASSGGHGLALLQDLGTFFRDPPFGRAVRHVWSLRVLRGGSRAAARRHGQRLAPSRPWSLIRNGPAWPGKGWRGRVCCGASGRLLFSPMAKKGTKGKPSAESTLDAPPPASLPRCSARGSSNAATTSNSSRISTTAASTSFTSTRRSTRTATTRCPGRDEGEAPFDDRHTH